MCSNSAISVLVIATRLLFLRLLLLLCRSLWVGLLLLLCNGLLKQKLLLPAVLRITNTNWLPVWSLACRAVARVAAYLRAPAAIELLLGRRDLYDDTTAVQPKCILVIRGFRVGLWGGQNELVFLGRPLGDRTTQHSRIQMALVSLWLANPVPTGGCGRGEWILSTVSASVRSFANYPITCVVPVMSISRSSE